MPSGTLTIGEDYYRHRTRVKRAQKSEIGALNGATKTYDGMITDLRCFQSDGRVALVRLIDISL